MKAFVGIASLVATFLSCASAWASSTAILARQPDSSTDIQNEPIVVTAEKPTRRAVYRFVENITADTDGQIARFVQPICPASFGLSAAYNRVIEQRLRDDALRIGLTVAGQQCDANVVVIVADDPRALVTKLETQRPQMFAGLEFQQVQDIFSTKQPVYTWQAIEPRGSDGRPLQRVMFLPMGHAAGNGAWLNSAPANSRIQQSIRPDLVTSFVVVATPLVDGLTLTQIADYAAMRTLARTHAVRSLTGQSILGIMNGDRSVSQLTSWDVAYLRSLYSTSNSVSAHEQQADMAGAMKRDLDKPRTGSP